MQNLVTRVVPVPYFKDNYWPLHPAVLKVTFTVSGVEYMLLGLIRLGRNSQKFSMSFFRIGWQAVDHMPFWRATASQDQATMILQY